MIWTITSKIKIGKGLILELLKEMEFQEKLFLGFQYLVCPKDSS